jgi:hypothetical protein
MADDEITVHEGQLALPAAAVPDEPCAQPPAAVALPTRRSCS